MSDLAYTASLNRALSKLTIKQLILDNTVLTN